MKLLQSVKAYFDNMLKAPNLEEIIAQKLKEKQMTVMQSEHVIKMHEFQKHMAEAEIKALNTWQTIQNTQKNILKKERVKNANQQS